MTNFGSTGLGEVGKQVALALQFSIKLYNYRPSGYPQNYLLSDTFRPLAKVLQGS